MTQAVDPDRAGALLFQPFPLGHGGLVLPNRIWLPAMVTWRGTADGFVTPAVHDIYMRYARGRPGMIVLEATGIRDVASGPLLRLSHDRYVPGLAALVAEMRAVTDSLIVPQIIDFLKIATRKPTRAFMEGMVARRALPESVLRLSDQEFEAGIDTVLPDRRLLRILELAPAGDGEEIEPGARELHRDPLRVLERVPEDPAVLAEDVLGPEEPASHEEVAPDRAADFLDHLER